MPVLSDFVSSKKATLTTRLCLALMLLSLVQLPTQAASPELDEISLPPQAKWMHSGTGNWDNLNNPVVGPSTPVEQVKQQLDARQAEADEHITSGKHDDPRNPVVIDMPTVTEVEDIPVQDFYAPAEKPKNKQKIAKASSSKTARHTSKQPIAQGILLQAKPQKKSQITQEASRISPAAPPSQSVVSTTISDNKTPAKEATDAPVNVLMNYPARSLETTISDTDQETGASAQPDNTSTMTPLIPAARQDIPLPQDQTNQTGSASRESQSTSKPSTDTPRLSTLTGSHNQSDSQRHHGPTIQSLPGYSPDYRKDMPPGVSISQPAMSPPIQLNHSEEQPYDNMAIADPIPARVQELSNRALSNFKASHLEQARQDINQALALSHDNPALLAALGEIQIKNNDLTGSEKTYTQVAQLAPETYSLRYSEVLALNHHRDKAIAVLEQILASPVKSLSQNQFGKVYYMLGTLHEELGHTAQAAQYLQQALGFMPDNADLNFNLGMAYELLGNAKFAKKYYSKAAKLDPTATDAKLALIRIKE